MNDKIPKIIQSVGFDFHWDEQKVWALDYPAEDMSIEELAWHFDIPFWNYGDEIYNLKPSQVLNDSEKYKAEYERTLKADLSYPLDIMENKGRWTLLDGLHRLLKAKILGQDTVKVRKIPRTDIPKLK